MWKAYSKNGQEMDFGISTSPEAQRKTVPMYSSEYIERYDNNNTDKKYRKQVETTTECIFSLSTKPPL